MKSVIDVVSLDERTFHSGIGRAAKATTVPNRLIFVFTAMLLFPISSFFVVTESSHAPVS